MNIYEILKSPLSLYLYDSFDFNPLHNVRSFDDRELFLHNIR